MSFPDENDALTDAVKASVKNSGVLASLQHISHENTHKPDEESLNELKQQAVAAIENIQQLLNSGNLDDGTSNKLTSVLAKLKTALGKGAASREALATALSEATNALSGGDGAGKNASAQQAAEKLWQKVDADNKAINDDFAKMREEGIGFSDNLWNKHKELTEYAETHPHDIKTQKELDAVDDALLMQAKPQLDLNPDAKTAFDDAEAKSKDRHQVVDKALAATAKKEAASNNVAMSDFDDRAPTLSGNVTLNDVVPPQVGQKPIGAGKSQGI